METMSSLWGMLVSGRVRSGYRKGRGGGRIKGRRGRGMERRGVDEEVKRVLHVGDKCVWEGHKD